MTRLLAMDERALDGLVLSHKRREQVAKREARFRRQALEAGLTHWRQTYAPLHFRADATRRYNYQERTGPYLRGRKRQLRHLRFREVRGERFVDRQPLRLTGGMRQAALFDPARFRQKLLEGRTDVELVLPVPRYAYQYRRPGDGKIVDKIAELTRLLPAETADMAAVAGRVYRDAVAALLRGERERVPGQRVAKFRQQGAMI